MTEGSSEFLNIIKNIPVNQRTLIIPSPLLLEMDDPTHFHGELKFQYNIPASKLSDQQKENLKNLGFKKSFYGYGEPNTAFISLRYYSF